MLAVAAHTRPIGLGTVDITDTDIALVSDCLRQGRVSPGSYTERFEQKVADYHGLKYGAFVNSGQSALHLSLLAWQRRRYPIRKVLVPAVTYISSLHAVWNAGLEVVLCDVDPFDWLLDVGAAEQPYDGAMPVDLFGKAWRSEGNLQACCLIEDACEALGAPGVGNADLVCVSFYASHSITTGCGGMVLTDDDQLQRIVKRLANHGRAEVPDGDSFDKSRQFVFTHEGYSFKNSDVNAALGLGQMDRLTSINARRRRNALVLLSRLARFEQLQLADSGNGHTFQMFPMVCREEGVKARLVAHLNDRHIETRDAMPIVTQPIVRERLGVRPGQFPVADHVAANGFYIGCHQFLEDSDLDYIADAFEAFFGG